MEAPSAAKFSSNADVLNSVVFITQGPQQSVTLVADAAISEESAMKNTWLNANNNETPLSAAPIMSAAPVDSTTHSPALDPTSIPRPLQLLDLPVDILKDIIKEVTHTNDLTSLALCHSALHRLVIPHIYSRFDIVWPDSITPSEPRTGVDALTYGLATLVMAEDVYGETSASAGPVAGQAAANPTSKSAMDTKTRRRKGNYYAHFTRKFSLGNGPTEWVQEYLISKEGGKMLGTLVALAIARMRNLEAFIWDMPTGILRDVWIALSSLGDRDDGQACRLDRVAVRFHDNSPEPHALPLHHPQPPGSGHPALDHVEHPSFSVLPPLKMLSVLDIDELQYLDEMSVLIGRSQTKLRELRVGLARHLDRDWTTVWEGDQLQQVDKENPTAGSVTIGEKRLGGVLGVLTAYISDMRRTYSLPQRPKRLRRRSNATVAAVNNNDLPIPPAAGTVSDATAPVTPLEDAGSSPRVEEDPVPESHSPERQRPDKETVPVVPDRQDPSPAVVTTNPTDEEDSRLCGKLSLEILELERVPLSIPVLQHVIDWGLLRSLTLLQCANHEYLWKTLRRLYSPVGSNPRHYATTDPSMSKQKSPRIPVANSEYRLKLTKLHTDTVTPSLITFIRETLAPDSLEVVFLQESYPDNVGNTSSVSIDSIFRGVLRKHRASLKKVLIDSSERNNVNSRAKRWMLDREMLAFITSGKMPALRELGVAIDYRDWHYFMQRLPSIPHLRSLYLPYMANYIHGTFIAEPRELALQIVDIVALRPEVELCYLGIAKKCFEILENVRGKEGENVTVGNTMHGDDGDDDEGDDDDDMPDEDEDTHSQQSSSESTEPADSDSEDEMESRRKDVSLSLREILYYDDKITIFKARHGRL